MKLAKGLGLTLVSTGVIAALVLFAPLRAIAGLESPCSFISDLVSTNPLSSDLASTSDDHLRCIKSAVKGSFPNVNAAVTATDEQLNATITNIAANPTGTVGLSTVNGSASTYLRSDGAPPLSQAITPTWTNSHTFSAVTLFANGSAAAPSIALTNSSTTGLYRNAADDLGFATAGTARMNLNSGGTLQILRAQSAGPVTSALFLNSNVPAIGFREADASADNGDWDVLINGEQLCLRAVNDAASVGTNALCIDRTGTTIDTINLSATNLQHNGVSIGGTTGTFTATATGCTTSPTGTATWAKSGNNVVLNLPHITCTSNVATFTYTGMSAAIQPSTVTQFVAIPQGVTTCNSVAQTTAAAVITAGSGTITFTIGGSGSGWCTSGTKGFSAAAGSSFTVAYTTQ